MPPRIEGKQSGHIAKEADGRIRNLGGGGGKGEGRREQGGQRL